MSETLEEKLVNKQTQKEIVEIFPNYGEYKTLKEGEPNKQCKILGHVERVVHHQFFTEKTKRGKEWYECHVCPRCEDVQGELVKITDEPKKAFGDKMNKEEYRKHCVSGLEFEIDFGGGEEYKKDIKGFKIGAGAMFDLLIKDIIKLTDELNGKDK